MYINNLYLELIPLPDLGSIYCEEAYPLLFLDYKKDINRLTEEFKMKTSKISLIGRTGQYFPCNIDKTLDSIL